MMTETDGAGTPGDPTTPGQRRHHHPHADSVDWAARGAQLVSGAEVGAPMIDEALRWLAGRVPHARDVLDVGSGPGVAACTLARLLPAARVLAVDGAEPLLAAARDRAGRLGVAARFATRQASLPDGLVDLPRADLVWVSGVMHHLPDPVAALRHLGALVRPGGLLAVREGGLSGRFLPDGVAPGLLARLEAIGEERVAAGDHPMGVLPSRSGWPDLMRAAGLRLAGSRSFLLDLPAPVTDEARRYVHHQLTMAREIAADALGPADVALLDRLLDPDAPEGVLRRADLFVLAAATVHTAQP